MDYQAELLILYFVTYSFIGYLCEVVYCSVPKRQFVNRGFLYGPYLPIYGFGAMLVALTFSNLILPWYLVFILSMLGTGIIEYIASWLLEKFFNMKLWDYSKQKFNINGRVCLKNALMFGLLSLVVVYGIHDLLVKFYTSLDQVLIYYLSLFSIVIITSDATLSIAHILAFKEKLSKISIKVKENRKEREKEGVSILGEIKHKIGNEYEEFKKVLRESLTGSVEHILKANPSLSSKDAEIRDAITKLKNELNLRKEKRLIDKQEKKNAKR